MSTKEVRFDIYCEQCENYEKSESEDPCFDCLNNGWNEDSNRPVFFKEKNDSRAKQSP